MLAFFHLAARSPTRQSAFRKMVGVHLIALLWVSVALPSVTSFRPATLLGHVLLVCGIVEGALLLGWRLTQLPKSQALEFLLVSPLRPGRVFLSEAAIGLTWLVFTSLAGLPVLLLLVNEGYLVPSDLIPLFLWPLTWGALTGVLLTAWAYEPLVVRRWGQRLLMGLILLQLLVGVLAGEHLKDWLDSLPGPLGSWLLTSFRNFHRDNPFAVMQLALTEGWDVAGPIILQQEVILLGVLALALARAAWRLRGHFHELHYQPAIDTWGTNRGRIGDRPLVWWAVRRVTRYAGHVNLVLAGGFGALYALYVVAGDNWPSWLGRQVFQIFDQAAGIPGLTTGLVVLAAVPAAFQYGLWDANASDRVRRLELLLLTELQGRDYWQAAVAAAWRRGRWYFAFALLLWGAALASGRMDLLHTLAALAAAVLLWGLCFAVGFSAFVRGMQSGTLGIVLTVGLPALAYALYQADRLSWAVLTPVGSVCGPALGRTGWMWGVGAVLTGAATLLLARHALHNCDRLLRRWYNGSMRANQLRTD